MTTVAPFKGIFFNPTQIPHLEEVVTPPYDVISENEAADFLGKNPYSMIQLDLRNTEGADSDKEEQYKQARDKFTEWQNKEVLVRDEVPAIYLYYIAYTHPSGRHLTRKGLVSLVELAEFSEGVVRPHEKTFDAVIVDRIKLMDFCKAQFSKVFSVFSDPVNEVFSCLEKSREPEPICESQDSFGNTHTLWRVTDQKALAAVSRFFRDRPVYIADGHHRYTTALNCRRRVVEKNGGIEPDNPSNFIMMYLSSMEDEGMSILPTHRLLQYPDTISADRLISKFASGLQVEEISGGSREVLIGEVLSRMEEAELAASPESSGTFGLYHPREDRCFLLQLREEIFKQASVLAEKAAVLRDLDVVVLSELFFGTYLGLDHQHIVRDKLVSYFSDPDAALDVAVKKSLDDDNSTQLLFLLNPTKIKQVTDVADAGEIMPHKSTYFYPKILTGMLINKLVVGEKIQRFDK